MTASKEDIARYRRNADIMEIQSILARYVTLRDQMEMLAIYEELFATDNPSVSVEYEHCGKYIGPDHVKAFFENLDKGFKDYTDKGGWLDFSDCMSPDIEVSEDGSHAFATWQMMSPKARQATPNNVCKKILTAFWAAGKMCLELVFADGQWKILGMHLVTYFTAPYELGWLKQQECSRETPYWSLQADEPARFYLYNPARVYVKGGQYDWGPYVPDVVEPL